MMNPKRTSSSSYFSFRIYPETINLFVFWLVVRDVATTYSKGSGVRFFLRVAAENCGYTDIREKMRETLGGHRKVKERGSDISTI